MTVVQQDWAGPEDSVLSTGMQGAPPADVWVAPKTYTAGVTKSSGKRSMFKDHTEA